MVQLRVNVRALALHSTYRYYMVVTLMTVLVFNYMDRFALGVMLQDIKADLALSDTELGVLGGIAFAVFYAIFGVPIARYADRGNRVWIIASTAGLWGIAVSLCGIARSFPQLLCIRVAVAVGEAGCLAPSLSLLADYFSREERPRAAAIYQMGIPLSALIGFSLAGRLDEAFGWRATFVALGAPGLLLALLVITTLEEPRRTMPLLDRGPESPSSDFLQSVRVLWRNAPFRHLLMCISICYFFSYGILQWAPAFYARSYGLTSAQTGGWFALCYGVAALAGTYIGGELASRAAGADESRQMAAVAAAICASALLWSGVFLTRHESVAISLMAISAFLQAATNAPIVATVQTVVPDSMRAVSFALIFFISNLVGMGLGPLAAGGISDLLHASLGSESLRYALLVLSPGYLWAGWHAWSARRSLSRTICA